MCNGKILDGVAKLLEVRTLRGVAANTFLRLDRFSEEYLSIYQNFLCPSGPCQRGGVSVVRFYVTPLFSRLVFYVMSKLP